MTWVRFTAYFDIGKLQKKYMLEALRLYRNWVTSRVKFWGWVVWLICATCPGRHGEAIVYMRQEIEKRSTLKDPQNEVFIQRRKGLVALMGFRFETAKEYLEIAIKISRKIGLTHHRIWALNLLQRVYFYLGDLDQAEAICYEVIGEWRKRGVIHWEAANFLYLGELALERGDFSQALEYAEISSERFLKTPRRRLCLSRLCDCGNGYCESG